MQKWKKDEQIKIQKKTNKNSQNISSGSPKIKSGTIDSENIIF